MIEAIMMGIVYYFVFSALLSIMTGEKYSFGSIIFGIALVVILNMIFYWLSH